MSRGGEPATAPPAPAPSAPTQPGGVGAALAAVTRRLRAAGVATPAADAAWLVRHVTGWSPARLLTAAAEPLDEEAAAALAALAARRAAREPLQLLLGTVGFRHLELAVAEGVFIPRPETEVLAEAVIARTPVGGIVVEPCTGTGAVACAVATEADPGVVVATDSDAAAVELARANARACGAAVDVRRGDLLAPVATALRGRVDVLVANPPYLAARELAAVPDEVARWDPHGALVAGETGYEVSDRLIAAARVWLADGGWLLLEVDERRAAECARRAAPGFAEVHVLPDLAGRDRVVAARRSAGP